MALQLNISFRGLGIANAYHRVVSVNASRTRNSNVIVVNIYPSKAAADAGHQPIDVGTAVAPFDNGMTFATAYDFLKVQESFAEAVDA